MSLVAKLSGGVLVVAPHDKHHGVWVGRPHHISNVSPSKIPKVDLHAGEWGTVGSVVVWHYVIGEPTNHLLSCLFLEKMVDIMKLIIYLYL